MGLSGITPQGSIGKNIRTIRMIRGYSLQEFADRLHGVCGKEVAPATISAWERGEKQMTAAMLHYCAKALQVSEQSLFDYTAENKPDISRLILEVSKLPTDELMTFVYGVAKFSGDTHALIKFNKLYMSLDERSRADIVGIGIHMFKAAKEAGTANTALAVDIEYLEKAWERLL